MAVQIQFRRGTSIEWANTQTGNPILAEAEMGIETDTTLFKIGDGINRWNDLPYGGMRGYQGSSGYTGSIGTMAVTNVLYVSKSGNDSYSGTTLGQSKLTIKAALAIATPGTTIFVKSGDYTEANPMIVPRNVSIIGDNLRSVTVRPINIIRDLFWVNNGCYLAHMTFKDHISPAAAVAFNPDGSAGIISTSPYVQNCTSITSTGTGMRVDGDHALGTRSMVVDAFTQYNQGGIGIHLLNRGYAQLVSVFTINCDKGFFCETGGFCSITNSNSSFGNYALYADGVSSPLQMVYITTATRKTITLSNLTSKPSIGDAIFLGTTGTYVTVNTSTDLRIGTNTIVNPTISNESATLRNARQAILNKKTRIQVETVDYIYEKYPNFIFDQQTCSRDISTILNAVAYDMVLGSNYQSVVSGIAYTRQASFLVTSTQKVETIDALQFVKSSALAALVPDTVPHIRVANLFDTIINIISSGTNAIPAIQFPNPSVIGSDVIKAKNQILANKDFIQAETIDYVSSTYPSFTYDKTLCYRDTGLIVDAIIHDLLYSTSSQSTFAGIQYYTQGSYTGQIAGELTTTTTAINYVRDLAEQVVTGFTTSRIQNTSTQTVGIVTFSTATLSKIRSEFNTIVKILNSGTNNITNTIVPNGIKITSDQDTINAVNSLKTNKDFIKAETIAYIDSIAPAFTYDRAVCSRDIGYMIDSVCFDLLYGGNKQAIQSGVSYYGYNSTANIIGEIPQTVDAYNYINSLTQSIILGIPVPQRYQNTVSQVTTIIPATRTETEIVASNFDLIVSILKEGTQGVTDQIVPNNLTPSINANVRQAYEALQANKNYLQAEAVAYVENTKSPGFIYDQAICYRDVGFMVDSISFDLLYGGNKQSVQSGVCYYGWSTTATSIPNEVPQTLDAYSYLRTLIENVIKGISSTSTYQNTVTQITSMSSGTQVEADLAKSKLDIITTIINSGTAYAGALTSINLVKNRGANLQAAAKILNANKQFFKEEVTAYINNKYTNFNYSTSTCYRDVGYIVDAVSWDMVFGSNYQSVNAGLAYYRGTSADVIGQQKEQTLAALKYLKTQIANNVTQFVSTITNSLMSTIIEIFDIGVITAPAYALPNPSTITQGRIDAKRLLTSNIEFIKEEIYRWIEVQKLGNINPFTSNFSYSTSTCKRDVGYIIDGLNYDITYGTNLATITSARAYFEGTVNVLPIQERTPTIATFVYLKSIVDDIAKGNVITTSTGNIIVQDVSGTGADFSAAAFLQNRVQEVIDVLSSNGTLPTPILPDTTGVLTSLTSAYSTLTNVRSTIQSNVIQFINNNYVNFQYNSAKCKRDIGLIIDSVAQDMLFDSTSQSTFAGLQYWNQAGYTGDITQELTTTTNAINYVNQLAQRVILKDTSGLRYQNTVSQVLTLATATNIVSSQIANLLSTITNIISNGPTGVSLTSIGNNLTTDTNVLTAISLLDANREFIQSEVIGYIDIKYPYLDTNLCARDINYIVDAVTYDLVYSGNSQVNVAAGAYYSGTRLSIEQEIIPVLNSYIFLKNLIKNIVRGVVVSPRQYTISQDTSNPGATTAESDTIEYLFGIINDILDNGYTAVVTIEETLRVLPTSGSTATTHQYSLIVSTGHSFEWIGAGTDINSSLPYLGGTPIVENQGYEVNGGKVNFTGTDQRGDFRIGNDLVINRINGTISGRTFTKSLFAVMTPYILAIGG